MHSNVAQFLTQRLTQRLTPIRKRTRLTTTFILFCLCTGLGLGLSLMQPDLGALAQTPAPASESTAETIGTVDPIPDRFQLGADLYLESCTTCHIGVPPQTLPLQTWQLILDDPEHYGVRIPPLVDPPRLLVWQYIRHFSRSLRDVEAIPYKLSESRYFKALHPRVDFQEDVTLRQCISCHPGASSYNFRQLTPEWDDAP